LIDSRSKLLLQAEENVQTYPGRFWVFGESVIPAEMRRGSAATKSDYLAQRRKGRQGDPNLYFAQAVKTFKDTEFAEFGCFQVGPLHRLGTP
jgi:hypothetical protein